MEDKEVRNDDFANEVILKGRPISGSTSITLSDREEKCTSCCANEYSCGGSIFGVSKLHFILFYCYIMLRYQLEVLSLFSVLLAYTWRSYKSQVNHLEMMQPYFGEAIWLNQQVSHE